MKLERVVIGRGKTRVSGVHYAAADRGRTAGIVYAHGYTAGKYSMDGLAHYLAGQGYSGLAFDFTGHALGCTGGALRSVQDAVGNLLGAIEWVAERYPRLVVVGHSMGAHVALHVASEMAGPGADNRPDIAGLACICAGHAPSAGFATEIGRSMLNQRRGYVTGAAAEDLMREVEAATADVTSLAGLPALFIAARQDVLVPVSAVEALAARLDRRESVVVVEGSHVGAPDRARSPVARWLEGVA